MSWTQKAKHCKRCGHKLGQGRAANKGDIVEIVATCAYCRHTQVIRRLGEAPKPKPIQSNRRAKPNPRNIEFGYLVYIVNFVAA